MTLGSVSVLSCEKCGSGNITSDERQAEIIYACDACGWEWSGESHAESPDKWRDGVWGWLTQPLPMTLPRWFFYLWFAIIALDFVRLVWVW